MKVFTYFEPVPQIDQSEQKAMIREWARSWERYGFEPEVLCRADCDGVGAEKAAAAEALIRSRPSANYAQYTVNTSMRWLAFQAAGGGLQTDYDVVNVGLTPGRLHEATRGLDCATLCGPNWTPAAVYATPEGCQTLVARILEHPWGQWLEQFGRPHISDQGIFNANRPGPTLCMVREYHQPKNPAKPLVHLANGSVWQAGIRGTPRSFLMAQLIEKGEQ
jgi:hypothetical protein